jgi:hypothetical protein
VEVSGTGPIWSDGSCPDDAAVQARRCFEIIADALAAVGAGLADVIRTRMFITDPAVADSVGCRRLPPADLPADTHVRTVRTSGTIMVDKVVYKLDVHHAFNQVLVLSHDNTIIITDLQGEILAERTRAAPGIHYVGNGRLPGSRPKNPQPSPTS